MKDRALVVPALLITLFLEIAISLLCGLTNLGGVIAVSVLAAAIVLRVKPQFVKGVSWPFILFCFSSILSVIIFKIGWWGTLRIGDDMAGYDPARYYYMARDLSAGKNILFGFNYVGIVYFYKIVFALFGTNPLVIIVLNTLMTYLAAICTCNLYLFFSSSHTSNNDARRLFALILLFPELLWYNCLSSREIVCLFCVTVSVYYIVLIFLDRITLKRLSILLLVALLLGIIRTSILLVLAITIFVLLFLNRKRINKRVLIPVVILSAAIGVAALQISGSLGSASFSFTEAIEKTIEFDADDASHADFEWSNNSIGSLLIADSFTKLLLLSPLRIVGYIIAPVPSIGVSFNRLFAGNYQEWQHLFTLLSALYYIIMSWCLVRVCLNYKKDKNALIVLLLFFTVFFSVSCGVSIIHERYRIMGVPFLLLTIQYGRNLTAYKKQSKYITVLAATAAIIFIVVYKFIG